MTFTAGVPRATVIGDGAMGTLCSLVLCEHGTRVTLWGFSPDHVRTLQHDRENKRYLAGYPFPEALNVVHNSEEAFPEPSLIISAVPTQFMRTAWQRLADASPRTVPVVSVAKGLEADTQLLPTEIIAECLGDPPLACLSGPSIAPEVAAKNPASLVAASAQPAVAELVQRAFSCPYFRVYRSTDVKGVEIAGAVKNVIAIAAGICDGLHAGDNTKASLLCRGLAEIVRLGVALGASQETFYGLAGVGDLYTTCASRMGRNRSAGERIGSGVSVDQVIASTTSIIEGIPTTRSVLKLAERHGVDMPIVEAVAGVLFGGVAPREAIAALMNRPLRAE